MLDNTLSSNQVKDSNGTSVNFQRISISGRSTVFAKVGETPSQPFRISIQHTEVGTGMKLRRRSVVRIDKTVVSSIDNVTLATPLCYVVSDAPIGALANMTPQKDVLAALIQLLASDGSDTTVKLAGTSTIGAALLEGSL